MKNVHNLGTTLTRSGGARTVPRIAVTAGMSEPLSPLRREGLCIGSETYVVGRMQSPRHQHSSSDNLDRMTAKLVSTPTLCRALRFWRELYVDAENADAASGRAFRHVPEVLGHGTTGRHAHYDYVAVFHLQAVRV